MKREEIVISLESNTRIAQVTKEIELIRVMTDKDTRVILSYEDAKDLKIGDKIEVSVK